MWLLGLSAARTRFRLGLLQRQDSACLLAWNWLRKPAVQMTFSVLQLRGQSPELLTLRGTRCRMRNDGTRKGKAQTAAWASPRIYCSLSARAYFLPICWSE